MASELDLKKAAEHWDSKARWSSNVPIRWWQSKQVVRHLNKKMCGEPLNGFAAGVRHWLSQELGGEKLQRGISVGCGTGGKELQLVKEGLVDRFDLFEISGARVERGIELASEHGLSDKLNFRVADAFQEAEADTYDIVYWDNALHHMLDVAAAVDWSRRVLKPDGFLVVHDFVGANRFQFSERNIEYASRVRRSLPAEFLEIGNRPGEFAPVQVQKVNGDRLAAADPTEAADSARIVSEVSRAFPVGKWIMLGGGVYHIGLNDLFWNFERYEAPHLLDQCLVVDDLLSELGENHYAAFIGRA
jgi:SAM-dependent methyltransferase